jgi:hypothetical protein
MEIAMYTGIAIVTLVALYLIARGVMAWLFPRDVS